MTGFLFSCRYNYPDRKISSSIMESNSSLRLNKLVSGIGRGLLGAVGGRALGLAGDVFAARILGPSVFGLYAIGWMVIRFFGMIGSLGMEKGVVRFGSRSMENSPEAQKGLFLQAFVLSAASGILLGLLLYGGAPWLANNLYRNPDLLPIFRWFAFAFPPLVFLPVVAAATRSTQEVGYSVLIQDIGQPLLGLAMMTVSYILNFGLAGVILSDIASLTLALAAGLVIVGRVFPVMIRRKITPQLPGRALLLYSVPASLAGAFVVYIYWVDRLMIGYFRTPFENGIYQAASQVSMLFSVILMGVNLISSPLFANAHHRQDRQTLEETYRLSTKWGIYFSFPILAVLVFSAGDVLTFLYGSEYTSGALVLIILLAAQLINLLTGSVNPLLLMTGNQNFLFGLSGALLGLAIVLNAVLIPVYGLYGAALSTAVCIGGLFLAALLWARYKIGIWPYDRGYLKGVPAAIVCVLAVAIVKNVNLPYGLDLILQGIFAAVSFTVMLVVQKLDTEDMAFVSILLKQVTGRK
jgi:O-antigen/teichoic acid export membrane protein